MTSSVELDPETGNLALLGGRLAHPDTRRFKLARAFRQFFIGKWMNILGTLIILFFLFLCAFGPMLAPYNPIIPNILIKLEHPSAAHFLGTDDLGRDILSRIMAGARVSLSVAAIILSIAVTSGVIIGGIAGYVGGFVDEVLMRITDLFLAFPALILAMAIAATLGASLRNDVIALSAVYWPWYARLVRSQVLSVRNRDFIDAARGLGATNSRILRRHVLPNSISPVIVQMTLDCGYAILATASLSFIGLGAQPPTPEWGAMIASGRDFLQTAWWYITFPGIALTATVLGFNLLGDGIRDFLDPRTRGQ